eukprot:7112075-Alexandrium_andersonii.AAC.1
MEAEGLSAAALALEETVGDLEGRLADAGASVDPRLRGAPPDGSEGTEKRRRRLAHRPGCRSHGHLAAGVAD